jgi:spermidine synthase
MTPEDLKSVVRTFREQFRYTMLWLTHYDAELVGSNSPILIDEEELDRRIREPAVLSDLAPVRMGSATDFLSYFVMGTEGMRNFSEGGILNTDDNLYLEFSAPFSIATPSVMEANVRAIIKHREAILPYLVMPKGKIAQADQKRRWADHPEAVETTGRALGLFLGGLMDTPEFKETMEALDKRFPGYAPARFLEDEVQTTLSQRPRFLQKTTFLLLDQGGAKFMTEISAVLVPISKERASIMFVDNEARVIYGQLYVSGYDKNDFVNLFVNEVIMHIRAVYQDEVENALKQSGRFPLAESALRKIRETIAIEIQKGHSEEAAAKP